DAGDLELAEFEDLLAAEDRSPGLRLLLRGTAVIRVVVALLVVVVVVTPPGVEDVEHLAGEGVRDRVVALDVVDGDVERLRRQVGRTALRAAGVQRARRVVERL